MDTLNFYLIRSFTVFSNILTSFQPRRVLQWNGAQNFKFPGFWLSVRESKICIHNSDRWNFKNFPDTNPKIKIILRLTKRGDQALISISTILKFSAMKYFLYFWIISLRFLRDKLLKILNVLCMFKTKKTLYDFINRKSCKINFLSCWKLLANIFVNMSEKLVKMIFLYSLSLRAWN